MAREAPDEFQRIRRFYAPLAGPGGLGLLDDAALVDCRGGWQLVVTADAIVEGVHYLPEDPPDLVARKLLRVNLSDLAAMGARPLHYLLTTALPAAVGADWIAEFARGLEEDQRQFGVDLLGGDLLFSRYWPLWRFRRLPALRRLQELSWQTPATLSFRVSWRRAQLKGHC